MNTPTPSPAPLSAEELNDYTHRADFYESCSAIWDNNDVKRLLATLTAKDEIIAGLQTSVDYWMRTGANHAQDASDANHRAETAESRVKVLEEALRPFARIASWGGLHDHNSDKLPVTVSIWFPKGIQEMKATAKDFRLASDVLDAALTPSDQVERT